MRLDEWSGRSGRQEVALSRVQENKFIEGCPLERSTGAQSRGDFANTRTWWQMDAQIAQPPSAQT